MFKKLSDALMAADPGDSDEVSVTVYYTVFLNNLPPRRSNIVWHSTE
jgi:hypothetical protein